MEKQFLILAQKIYKVENSKGRNVYEYLWNVEVMRLLPCFHSTLHVSINLRMPLQNRWLKEICTKSSRFMLTNCWTQQLWEICCCSLTWMVMSAPINTTNVSAVWASTWMRTKKTVYWGYLKAILVEEARKNSCYLSVTLHPCDGTRNSSEFVSWSTSSGTEAEGNRAGMGKEWAGTLALSLPELW